MIHVLSSLKDFVVPSGQSTCEQGVELFYVGPPCSVIVSIFETKGLEFETPQKHHWYLSGRASGMGSATML